ncbi:uncharacterized protein LOC122643646 [Telopea speciosissima]|uniref:uncharacterized protein LOC122643646 n=1 Tax=Telopea speciosissima TaxID=54955 RepID=UPI001CC76B0F|nr:uncharacterized protein LOC122643646 [Telopea speciosissima]
MVDEQHKTIFPTAKVRISNTNMLVDDSSSVKRKRTRKKTNITWKHCQRFDHPTIKGNSILHCNYFQQKYHGGGIHRMKQHLGHQEKGDATPCPKVPPSVRNEIQNNLKKVSARKKVMQGNADASKEIQDKHHSSTSTGSFAKVGAIQIQGQGREDTSLVVKEGNMKAGQTGINVGLSRLLVDSQQKLVEKVTPLENMNCNSIAANHEMSHVNDETMVDNMEEAIDATTVQRAPKEEIFKITIDGKEHKFQRDSAEEFITSQDKATTTTIAMVEVDEASPFKLVLPTVVKQRIEVPKS